ncbi:MAG: hypothetical protein JXP73_07460 [Deltaproteobacteria bacterium]|nr:hypothetical protein [Deltaproteobacteria bacterium]
MASGSGAAELLGRLAAGLDAAGVPYMLTGSFASTLFGAPRTTQDIDIVIDPSLGSLEKLLRCFPEDAYYVSRDAAREAYGTEGTFDLVDFASGWKIDFIMRKRGPFGEEEFRRRRLVEVLGARFFVATAEDVIVAKLEWAKFGESERRLRDVAGMLRGQQGELDLNYIRHWVEALKLGAQWEAACARVGLLGFHVRSGHSATPSLPLAPRLSPCGTLLAG